MRYFLAIASLGASAWAFYVAYGFLHGPAMVHRSDAAGWATSAGVWALWFSVLSFVLIMAENKMKRK